MAWMRTVFAIVAMTLGSACAVSRSEITVAPQPSTQPAGGVAVVVMPTDGRRFEAAPALPSNPSLKEPSQITDKQITSRAVARKRNTYGMALGDVLLAPPQTVASLVGNAVAAGLRDSGYRVLEPNDPEYASAPKVEVQIVQFWTWVTPGFAQIKLDNATELVLAGNLPTLSVPVTISVQDSKGYGGIFESDWGPFIAAPSPRSASRFVRHWRHEQRLWRNRPLALGHPSRAAPSSTRTGSSTTPDQTSLVSLQVKRVDLKFRSLHITKGRAAMDFRPTAIRRRFALGEFRLHASFDNACPSRLVDA